MGKEGMGWGKKIGIGAGIIAGGILGGNKILEHNKQKEADQLAEKNKIEMETKKAEEKGEKEYKKWNTIFKG